MIYIRYPRLRKFGDLSVAGLILGAMSKATAVVFGGILLLYIFLFEEGADWKRWWPALSARETPGSGSFRRVRHPEYKNDRENVPAVDYSESPCIGLRSRTSCCDISGHSFCRCG